MKEPTTVHWHGILVPNLMDGVPNVSQVPLPQGVETTYSWPVVQGEPIGITRILACKISRAWRVR
ncbi:multicopper oxidase domain-containing protein [Plesiomonas shigelloides subsp. oncorhynchi]|nr:multicopper oxidase domain-containing protein [Plesiomonas shigelloides]